MPRTLQFKRYGSATLANTIGANGELIINQTNKTLTVHDGITPGGFTLLNEAIEIDIDQYARNQANTASNNITIIQGVNTTQNTNITNATNLAQSAYNYANTIVSDTQIDPYARTTANSASNNITIIQGVNSTQNTNINNASNLAQAAYDNSNTKYSSSGGTISGNVTISGILNVESTINVNNVLTVSTSPPAASPSITVIATQNHDLRLRAVSNTWTFRSNGTTIFPTNITIDYSGNNVQFPRIIADSEKAFSIQGQGDNGSAAMAWSIDHNADTQYAAVGVSRGGDNLAKVILTAGNTTPTLKVWKFDQTGAFTFPDLSAQNTAFTDAQVTNISNANTKAQAAFDKANTALANTTGSWTVTTGANTYSFTVPSDGTYVMWVKGNIPNGIITWNATLSISNSNVPAIGTQYAWNYTGGGSPILLTTLPDQIRGTANTISTDNTYVGSTSNRFDFGISNSSGSSQTIYYGYTKI
jgi:hypothetical protein